MFIIGDSINSSNKSIKNLLKNYNEEGIIQVAQEQLDAGVTHLNLNCGTLIEDETEKMEWLVKTIQKSTDAEICIESASADVIEHCLNVCERQTVFINGITANIDALNDITPLIQKFDAKAIAMCADNVTSEVSHQSRLDAAEKAINFLIQNDVPITDIYLNPMVKPISTGDHAGNEVLQTIKDLQEYYPSTKLICRLSDISYGLPNRSWIEMAFLSQVMAAGIDNFILNPMNKSLMAMTYAADALLGNDPFCGRFIAAHKAGSFPELDQM